MYQKKDQVETSRKPAESEPCGRGRCAARAAGQGRERGRGSDRVLPTLVRSDRRPALGGSLAAQRPGSAAARASGSWRARPQGAVARRAWQEGGMCFHKPRRSAIRVSLDLFPSPLAPAPEVAISEVEG